MVTTKYTYQSKLCISLKNVLPIEKGGITKGAVIQCIVLTWVNKWKFSYHVVIKRLFPFLRNRKLYRLHLDFFTLMASHFSLSELFLFQTFSFSCLFLHFSFPLFSSTLPSLLFFISTSLHSSFTLFTLTFPFWLSSPLQSLTTKSTFLDKILLPTYPECMPHFFTPSHIFGITHRQALQSYIYLYSSISFSLISIQASSSLSFSLYLSWKQCVVLWILLLVSGLFHSSLH